MVQFRHWGEKEKVILWAFFVLCVLNLIIGLLALGPDIFHW